jgi:hypothetical protein
VAPAAALARGRWRLRPDMGVAAAGRRMTQRQGWGGSCGFSDAGAGVSLAAPPAQERGQRLWRGRGLQRSIRGCSGGGSGAGAAERGGGDGFSNQTRGWRWRLRPWSAVVVRWVGKKVCIILKNI